MVFKKINDYSTSLVKDLKHRVDRDVIFTALNQIIGLISGPIMLILIPTLLSPELQGYWFTMMSLASLYIFADLGFTSIVLQFSAHEFAFLSFDKKNELIGDELHLKKIASLFKFCLKWILLILFIGLPLIYGGLTYVLSIKNYGIDWFGPWVIYIIAFSLDFITNFLLNFFEGCNSVAKIQKLRFIGGIIYSVSIISFLFGRFTLYALGFAVLTKTIIILIIIFKDYHRTVRKLWKLSKEYNYQWKTEFLPLMSRYSVSYASSYLSFSVFVPLCLIYLGPIEAGKLGISLSLWQALLSIAYVWITSVTPKLNMNIEKKNWKESNSIYWKNVGLSISTFFFGGITILVILVSFQNNFTILKRFLGLIPMIICFVSCQCQVLLNGYGVYLRAHKQDPLMVTALLHGIYSLVVTIFCGLFLPPEFFMLGFLTVNIWAIPYTIYIYKNKVKLWHSSDLEKKEN